MGKNNNPEAIPERTIFDELGIQPPKNVKVREMAEHVLSKTVQYAKDNGSCSSGTAGFLIDTLDLKGVTADELAGRINKVGTFILTVTFDVVTTADLVSRLGGSRFGQFITTDSSGCQVPVIGAKMGDTALDAYSAYTRDAAVTVFGTYTDYFRDGGRVHSVVSGQTPVEKLTLATVG